MTGMDAVATGASAEHPTWNEATLVAWLDTMITKGVLTPRRTLVLGADMAEEAALLASRGFRTLVVDAAQDALARVRERAEARGATVGTVCAEFLALNPSLCGPVELVLDRTFFHRLEPVQRADWAHRVGRILPRDGMLVGLFRVGWGEAGPPYPVTLPVLRHLLARLFREEILEQEGSAGPGKDQAYRGLFRHK